MAIKINDFWNGTLEIYFTEYCNKEKICIKNTWSKNYNYIIIHIIITPLFQNGRNNGRTKNYN